MVCKTLQEFEKRWENKCSIIKNSELTISQAGYIADGFLDEIMIFYWKSLDNEARKNGVLLMKEAFNDLDLALQIAISNHRKRHKTSMIEKIFGIKNFQMDVNGFKNVVNQ